MDYQKLYQEKLTTAENALVHQPSGGPGQGPGGPEG